MNPFNKEKVTARRVCIILETSLQQKGEMYDRESKR